MFNKHGHKRVLFIFKKGKESKEMYIFSPCNRLFFKELCFSLLMCVSAIEKSRFRN